MKRTIFLVPKTEKISTIQQVREKYDPLAHKIMPHITVVFPFQSTISNEDLEKHIRSTIQRIERFTICLKKTTLQDGYIFLHVETGNVRIINLHDALYTGPLAQYLSQHHKYTPHVTLGRVSEEREVNLSELKQFNRIAIKGEIDTIWVEEIQEDESSKILMKIPLDR